MWQSSTIGTAAPSEIEDLKSFVENIKSANAAFFGFLKAQAELAKAMTLDVLHPQLVAINATCDQILDLIDDIEMGPVRMITISPHTYGVTPKYDRVTGQLLLQTKSNISYLLSAMNDEGDVNRPSGSGNWGAFIMAVSCYTGDIANAMDTITSMADFFSLTQFSKLRDKIELIINKETVPKPIESKKPDFTALVTANFLPELQEGLDYARSFVEGIKEASTKAGDVFDLMIEYFDNKQTEVDLIISKVQAYLDKFVLGIGGTGLYWNYIPVQVGGVNVIKSTLSNTTEFPAAWSAHDFSVSLMIAGGDPLTTIGEALGAA